MAKTEVLYVRLTKAQREAIEQIARDQKFEISLAEIVRVAVDYYVERYEQESPRVTA